MQLKFLVFALSLFVVLPSGALQVLANQSPNSKSCTSTSITGRASCTSTSSSQSPLSSEQSNPSQKEQTNPAGRSLEQNNSDASSSSLDRLNSSNASNNFPTGDRPTTSSQEQSNPSLRLDRPSNPSGIESGSNTSIIENDRSSPTSSERTNEGEDESLASSNRTNGGEDSTPTSSERTNGGENSAPASSERSADSESAIEQDIHKQINQYRAQQGLPELTLNESISKEAQMHSENMASGAVAFSHDGFGQRVKAVSQEISTRGSAENVAFNGGYGDPATQAVQGWINSPGHCQNIEGNYNLTGIGVAKNSKGEYYFTQIFIRSNRQE